MQIAVVGASGQRGQSLIKLLKNEGHSIIALSRSAIPDSDIHWIQVDFLDLVQLSEPLAAVERFFYLLKPIFPTAGLDQGENLAYALLMADNFLKSISAIKLKEIYILEEDLPIEIKSFFEERGIEIKLFPLKLDAQMVSGEKKKFGHEVRSLQIRKMNKVPPMMVMANLYMNWISHFFKKIIFTFQQNQEIHFCFLFKSWKILSLKRIKEDPDLTSFNVIGGWLAKVPNQGIFEFRRIGKYFMTALHHFNPRLPWIIYRMSQALIHRLTMNAFLREIEE